MKNRTPFIDFHGVLIFTLAITALLASTAPAATTVTVHKSDDTVVAGDLLDAGNGTVTVKTKDKPITISLEHISQVVFRDPPAAPPPPPPPVEGPPAAAEQEDAPTVASGLFRAFFGGASHTATSNTPPAPPAPPAAPTTAPTTVPSTEPATVLDAVLQLTDGDHLACKVQSWQDQKMVVQLNVGGVLPLPSSAIATLWSGTSDLQAKAMAIPVEDGPEDIAYVKKDADVVSVKGLVKGIEGSSLIFRYGDQDRKIGLSKLVGLKLRSNALTPLKGFHQAVKFGHNDVLSGTWTGVTPTQAVITTPFGVAVSMPFSEIYSIDCVNGLVVYVSDLTPTRVEQTPYFGRLINYQRNQSLTGGPLKLSDGTYTRGIAVHSKCVLQYDISGGFDRFKTKLGFEDPDGRNGRVAARVLLDGQELWQNPDFRGDQKPVDLDLKVTSGKTLTLEIDFGQDQDVGDRVIWAMPRLIRSQLPRD